MSGNVAPNTVTDGLVLYLDASNTNSYPRSGTIWYDLTINKNDLTLVNSPTYNSITKGFVFNGTNNYGTFANNPLYTTYGTNQTNQKWTVECWFNAPSKGTQQPLIGEYTPNQIGFGIGLDFQPTQNQPLMYTDGTYYLYGNSSVADSTNRCIAYTFDGSSNQRNQVIYYNGVLNTSRQDTISATYPTLGNTLTLAKNGTYYLSGTLYVLKIYTRALSSTEILQNYNALKGRYR